MTIAWRNLRKYRGFSAINIAGLAIGMACCLIILVYVNSEIGYDTYHKNGERLYRLTVESERLGQGMSFEGATSSILWAPVLNTLRYE